jgi:hypothetical protein
LYNRWKNSCLNQCEETAPDPPADTFIGGGKGASGVLEHPLTEYGVIAADPQINRYPDYLKAVDLRIIKV